MQRAHPSLERLARGHTIVLDGGASSELSSRGYRPQGPLRDAAAAREAPEQLSAIHRAYIDAGADVITAYTGGTSVRALTRGGLGMRAAALTSRAIDLAVEAAARCGRNVAVAGLLATLEDPERPRSAPSTRTLADEHAEQAHRLEAAGCDLVIVDAMPSVVESVAAVAAARRFVEHVWVRFRLVEPSRVADGLTIDRAATLAVAAGAGAAMIEVPAGVDGPAAVAALAGLALGVPIGYCPDVPDDHSAALSDVVVADVGRAMKRGARIIGGGAHTRPDQLRQIALDVRARAAA